MEALNKILSNLTRLWNTLPKDIPVLYVQKGTGRHSMISVDTDHMYFHSTSYMPDMPVAEVIYLDDYTLRELEATINSMGYIATLISEDPENDNDYSARKAFTLMEVLNVPLIPQATLTAFTSVVWRTIYPLARAVDAWAKNTEEAIPNMYATTTTGKWADYWATFFSVQRQAGESDENLRKRTFMNLASLKTNNLALGELVSMLVKDNVTVKDISPALFAVSLDPRFMGSTTAIRSIIDQAKAGGVAYYLDYLKSNTEDYKAYFKDTYGVDFVNSDILSVGVGYTEDYSYPSVDRRGKVGFRTLYSKTVNDTNTNNAKLSVPDRRYTETCTMTLTNASTNAVVRTAVL